MNSHGLQIVADAYGRKHMCPILGCAMCRWNRARGAFVEYPNVQEIADFIEEMAEDGGKMEGKSEPTRYQRDGP